MKLFSCGLQLSQKEKRRRSVQNVEMKDHMTENAITTVIAQALFDQSYHLQHLKEAKKTKQNIPLIY